MSEPGQGTDREYEESRGRIALWLRPEEVAWLAKNCICETTSGHHTVECVAIRYRAGNCLHAYDIDANQPECESAVHRLSDTGVEAGVGGDA